MITNELYLANAPVIENAIRVVARRHRLGGADEEDFASAVRVKLIDDDCAVLRKFQQRSSMQTFLVAVVQRVYLDHRNKAWGKWRPSAEAQRMGPLAVELERLVGRDRLSFEEAAETVRARRAATLDAAELEDIRARLPVRVLRTTVGEHVLDSLPAGDDLEASLAREEGRSLIGAVSGALPGALGDLESEDRLLIKLRFYEGMTIADIARMRGLDQKPLYRRLERALGRLRSLLAAAGFRDDLVAEALRDQEAL